MILSMQSQFFLFLYSIAVGGIIGFIYDIFRIIRKTFPHNNIFVNIEDILYWLIVTFIAFYFLLNYNNGEIRFFNIIGLFLGMSLYFLTFSKLILKVSITIIHIIERILKIIIKIISVPLAIILKIVRFILNIFKKIIRKLANPTKKIIKKTTKYGKSKKNSILKELRVIKKKI